MIITLQKSQAAHVVCTRCCPTETMSAHIFGAKSKWHRSQSTHVERITFNDVPTQGVPVVQVARNRFRQARETSDVCRCPGLHWPGAKDPDLDYARVPG